MNEILKISLMCLTLGIVGCNKNDDSIDSNVIYYNDFSESTSQSLPIDWHCSQERIESSCENIYINNGYLYIDATNDDYATTSINLPDLFTDLSSFKIEMNFTIDQANNSSRWVGFKYLMEGLEPFYQMVVRSDATAGNGTEFTYRSKIGTVIDKAPFSEKIDKNKMYHAVIIVNQNRVQHFLNDQLVNDNVIKDDVYSGLIGVQAAGSILKLKNIKVSSHNSSLDELPHIYQPLKEKTPLIQPMLLVKEVRNITDIYGEIAFLLNVNSDLMVVDDDNNEIGLLQNLYSEPSSDGYPLLVVSDIRTVDSIALWARNNKALDISLISNDIDVLAYANEKVPEIRTIIDFSNSSVLTKKDLSTLVGMANSVHSHVVILPENLVSYQNAKYFQRMLMQVWAKPNKVNSMSISQALSAGMDGLIAYDTSQIRQVINKLPENTVLKTPMITGHRGNPSQRAENTLEGALLAVDIGADAVEYDIYLTTDKEVVVMHDSTVNRTTDGVGKIEEMTLEEVKQLNIFDEELGNLQVPTLDEFLTTFKSRDITHFIEIKSKNPEIVTKLEDKLREHDVFDQVISISTQDKQLKNMALNLPEVPLGYLTGLASTEIVPIEQTIRNIINTTQELNATYNPPNANLTQEIIEKSADRGIIMMPRTLKTHIEADDFFLFGAHGLPSNYAQWFSDYIIEINPCKKNITIATNERLTVDVEKKKQNKNIEKDVLTNFIVLDSSANYRNDKERGLFFTSSGKAIVVAIERYNLTNDRFYHLISSPIEILIN